MIIKLSKNTQDIVAGRSSEAIKFLILLLLLKTRGGEYNPPPSLFYGE